jgi:NMD protein affecting ribosome stability and mRNA decay
MKPLPHKNYYEGILQLREATDEVVDFVMADIDRQRPKGVFLTKVEKVRGGVDLYLSSKRYISNLGRQLYAMFGGEMKSSAQLYTRDHQSGKDVYRLNVYFCPSQYKKGQLIKVRNVVLKITSCAKKINAVNLVTGKRAHAEYSDDIKVLEPVYKTMVTKTKPSVEVLDPETYQSVPVMNQRDYKHGEKVKIVKNGNEIWLL